MRRATHRGFRRSAKSPSIEAANPMLLVVPSSFRRLKLPDDVRNASPFPTRRVWASAAVGVGYVRSRTAVVRLLPPCGPPPCLRGAFHSPATGVGQRFAATANGGLLLLWLGVSLSLASCATGVGNIRAATARLNTLRSLLPARYANAPIAGVIGSWSLAVGVGKRSCTAAHNPTHPSRLLRTCSADAVGVGHFSTAPGRCRLPSLAFLRPVASCRVGVGHFVTRLLKAGFPLLNNWFGPPFSPSDARGVGHLWTAVFKPSPDFRDKPRRLLFPVTVGVGHPPEDGSPGSRSPPRDEPPPIPLVGRAKGARREARPLTIVPATHQGPENGAQPISKDRRDVLHDDEAGSQLADESVELPKEPRPRAREACAASGPADVLARESTHKDVARREVVRPDLPDVLEPRDVGPVLREDAPAERVALDLEDDLPEPRVFQPFFEPPDAAEEAANPHTPTPKVSSGLRYSPNRSRATLT